mmetsp:Transcript_56943/g.124538  ORF Transcript_56943/g.124538 Transcript_56943/m.124538 type:complete len:197 (-) Transcript_56943:270-860(-)
MRGGTHWRMNGKADHKQEGREDENEEEEREQDQEHQKDKDQENEKEKGDETEQADDPKNQPRTKKTTTLKGGGSHGPLPSHRHRSDQGLRMERQEVAPRRGPHPRSQHSLWLGGGGMALHFPTQNGGVGCRTGPLRKRMWTTWQALPYTLSMCSTTAHPRDVLLATGFWQRALVMTNMKRQIGYPASLGSESQLPI